MERKHAAFTSAILAMIMAVCSFALPVRPAAAATGDMISITEPTEGALVTSPLRVRGTTNFWPFEANLGVRILDASGKMIGQSYAMVTSEGPPQGGPFEGTISFTQPSTAQNGTLQVYDASAKDGSILTIASVGVRFAARPALNIQLASPTPGTGVTLPLHVALHGAIPGDKLVARLRYSSGTMLEQPLHVVTGPDGVGYAVANMSWSSSEGGPPGPIPSGKATFQIARTNGTVLKSFVVSILPDSKTRPVEVAWTPNDGTNDLIIFKQRVYRTPRIGTAALNELVNGPPDGNLVGASTAFPTLEEILNYAGRESDWGYEVKLLSLNIRNGVATANFSQELRAFGGGSYRVGLIRAQIERTLKQFPTVQRVVIQIEGDSNALQP
jgi:hypothetical protein